MQLIKSIVRPDKVDDVKDALAKLSVSGMTVTECARAWQAKRGHTAVYPRQGIPGDVVAEDADRNRRAG